MNDDKWDLLSELAGGNEHWSRVLSFMKEVKDRELSSLTQRQVDWMCEISMGLQRELDRRDAKEVFRDG